MVQEPCSSCRHMPCPLPGLVKIREKFPWRHGESLGELYDILQRNISFAPLYSANIVSIQTRSLG